MRDDSFIKASIVGIFVGAVWLTIPFAWVKQRRERAALAEAPACVLEPAPVVVIDTPAPPPSNAPAEDATPQSRLTRFGIGMLIFAIVAGGLLWQIFDIFPNEFALWGYAVVAVGGVVGGIAFRIGLDRDEAVSASAASSAAPFVASPVAAVPADDLTPAPGAALLCVMRYQGFSTSSYMRVSVGGHAVAVLKSDQYAVVSLRPGTHLLAINARATLVKDTVAHFEIAAGDVVVYQMVMRWFASPQLKRMTQPAGWKRYVRNMKRIEPSVDGWSA